MLYFRADMNEKIATGHIMRCLSIADAVRSLGEGVTFILADKQAEGLIRERGHQCIILHSEWDNLDSEIGKMVQLIRIKHIRVLLVDSYFITEHYLAVLRKQTFLVYMDDVSFVQYPVDAVLCYAPYHEMFNYSGRYDKSVELMLGIKYAPLRKEFRECSEKYIRTNVENILIMSGGSDQYDIVGKVLKCIDIEKYEHIYAICGVYNRKYEELKELYSQNKSVEVIKATMNMKYYMEKADIAVSAAGSTLYELAAIGTPTISYVVADNQINNALWWDKEDIIKYVGDVRNEEIIERIFMLIDTKYEKQRNRMSMSRRMQEIVDGKGSERVAEWLIKFGKR